MNGRSSAPNECLKRANSGVIHPRKVRLRSVASTLTASTGRRPSTTDTTSNVDFEGRTKMFVSLFQIRRQHIFDPFHECADSAPTYRRCATTRDTASARRRKSGMISTSAPLSKYPANQAFEQFGIPKGHTGPAEEMFEAVNAGWMDLGVEGTEHVAVRRPLAMYSRLHRTPPRRKSGTDQA